ncbi:MAG TPA: secretin N-terminal domain-containing protein [Pyrinomonadaceae bacterium]|nr:secretin N-terminal domain-containing protein [Pyrinomonadaceae bacterium]
MKNNTRLRTLISLALALSLLALPLTAFGKKGDKNFKRGMDYENKQQWDKAAQEYTLAVAADPSNMEYQLHFRRASFNASQTYMQQGRSLSERGDFVGAYNAFRQAYGYDPVNELAVSEMERMLRLQAVKEGRSPNSSKPGELENGGTTTPANGQAQDFTPREQQLRVVDVKGDLKTLIRNLADQLNLNVIFDRQSFAQARQVDISLKDVTTAQALDYLFLQEGLFFQKLSRRTILVADQARRPQYQQLVLRTFFLSNMKPADARTLVQQAIPPSVGRPQTIVVPDDATNSLTVRDTAENVRLIGDLLQSIDKDRAEVVMDVSIYEVSKSDLLQLGNQIGDPSKGNLTIGGSPGWALLTDNAVVNAGRGVNLGLTNPTALAAALVIPPSILTAFQNKNNTKLIASTQVHAFNGEESTARIGQRVPVQTAQAYPFGVQTGTPSPNNQTLFPTGGFPVINYEPTGLTLKFTPQVFPNLDVQVKMNIESKDVLGANSLTPTFTERTITGTARVQNNRTMMLASVSQDIETHGRQGLPFLGGLPILGRLFTSPTRDNRTVDIVISVTPRVLRAPAVTPRDEEMRPSGTLQSPTTGSLAEMIREADREDQIAAARTLPKNVTLQLPDAPLVKAGETVAQKTTPSVLPPPAGTLAFKPESAPVQSPAQAPAQAPAPAPVKTVAADTTKQTTVEDLPAFVPAPKSLISDQAAANVATVNPGNAGSQNAVLTSLPKPQQTALAVKAPEIKSPGVRVAQLTLLPDGDVLKIGEKRRYAVQLNSDVPLSLALLALKFDPKVVKVNGLTAGNILPTSGDAAPIFTPVIDATGTCLISISSLNGKASFRGSGPLLFIDLEAVGAGDASLSFVKDTLHLVATDARDVTSQVVQGTATVKQ